MEGGREIRKGRETDIRTRSERKREKEQRERVRDKAFAEQGEG